MPQPEIDTTSRPTNVDIAAFPSNRNLSSPPPTPLVSSANMVSAPSLESEESTDCSSSIDYEMELSSPSSFMPSSPEEMEISSPASPYPPAPTSALEWTTDELQVYMDCMLPLSSPRFSVPSEEIEISSSPPASPENPTPATKTPLTAMPTAQLQAFIDRIRDDKSADSSNPTINARWAVVSYILKHGISSPKKLDRSYVTKSTYDYIIPLICKASTFEAEAVLALLKTNTRFRDLRHKHKTAEQQLNNNLNEVQSEMRILEDVADAVQMQLGRLYKEKEKAERKQFLLADKLWKLEEKS